MKRVLNGELAAFIALDARACYSGRDSTPTIRTA